MEPAKRVELLTDGLRNRCSTTELRWLSRKVYHKTGFHDKSRRLAREYTTGYLLHFYASVTLVY